MGAISYFFLNGSTILREASRGRYNRVSQPIKEMREEMLASTYSRKDDRQNLARDSRKVCADMRKSYNKLSKNND